MFKSISKEIKSVSLGHLLFFKINLEEGSYILLEMKNVITIII